MQGRRLGRRAAAAGLAGMVIGAAATGSGAAAGGDPVVTPLIPAPAVTYVTTGNPDSVWMTGLSGTPARRLGSGDSPLVSPTGTVVATHSASHGYALTIYGAAKARSLFDLRREYATAYAFSPGGRYLAVGLISTKLKPRISDSRVVVVDIATGAAQTVGYGYPCGASFAPTGSRLRIVFALAGSTVGCENGAVDLFTITGGSARKLTHDGRSTDPVWGRTGIIFTRLTYRRNTYPAAQLWLFPAAGGPARQQTHVRIGQLVSGLYPQNVSADGLHVLAAFSGQDTDEAWTVDLRTHKLHRLTVHGQPVVPGAVSTDGRTVVVATGDPLGPARDQNVVAMPFAGGPATVIARHAGQPSWNR